MMIERSRLIDFCPGISASNRHCFFYIKNKQFDDNTIKSLENNPHISFLSPFLPLRLFVHFPFPSQGANIRGFGSFRPGPVVH